MKLKVKLSEWRAGAPVAILNKNTAQKLGVRTKERIFLKTSSNEMSTLINTTKREVGKNEIAVSSEIKTRLKLKQGQEIEVFLSRSTKSLKFIKKKLNNKQLTRKEILEIVKDIVNNSLSEVEIALFISAMYKNGMSFNETIFLIESIFKTGDKLHLKNKIIADKHSIGGIPGRTTPIVVSICSATGLVIPKTSSRAITSPAGTADVIETLARVDFSMNEVKKIIKKTRACMVWGGGLDMVPADSKIIQVEKMLNIDPKAQMLASIMAKKLVMGSNHIIIHIPYGKTAKVNMQKAVILKKKFEKLGRHFKIKLKCILTKNEGPLGNGVGPVLEMLDVIKVLDSKQQGPEILKERALTLSGELLELTGKAKKNNGYEMAEEILSSGKAFKKFKEIIKAQEGHLNFKKLIPAKIKKDFFANKSGKILEIDNKKINLLAHEVGCPTDKSAGIYLYFNVGDNIKKGDKIVTIYSKTKSREKQAVKFYKRNKIIKIS